MTGSSLPEVVYHYTSMDSLQKILESRELWSTSIRYLNDVLERKHYFSAIKPRIPELIAAGVYGARPFLETLNAPDEETKPFFALPFVTSFSKLADSLPQWRSYCPNGNGVSIGFKTASLVKSYASLRDEYKNEHNALLLIDLDLNKESGIKIPINPTTTFKQVTYARIVEDENKSKGTTKVDLVDTLIKIAIDNAENTVAEYEEQDVPMPIGLAVLEAFDTNASLVKHHSFSEEHEFRLVTTLQWGHKEYLRYRTSKSTLIPYIALSLVDPQEDFISSPPRTTGDTKPFFIDHLIVGPSPNQSLSIQALDAMFRFRGYDVKVDPSNIPFRDL
jgi:hypothetical protein